MAKVELKEDFFDIEFPPGTEVHDEIAGLTYVIQPREQIFNEWLENESFIAQTAKTNEKKAETLTKETAAPDAEKEQITLIENKQSQPLLAVKNSKDNAIIYILTIAVGVILVILFFVGKGILNRRPLR